MTKNQRNEPSLRVLAFTLRNRELWPEGFQWNFNSCETCAIGMTKQMWPNSVRTTTPKGMAEAFKITEATALGLFTGPTMPAPTLWDALTGTGNWYSDVSPAQVASRIDVYLETADAEETVEA